MTAAWKILIIDDNPEFRLLISTQLRSRNITVFGAPDIIQAISLAPRVFGPTWPQRCDGGAHDDRALLAVWPRDVNTTPATGSRCLIEVAAMPSFFSPFRWRLIAQMSNAYELHDVDVLDARLRRPPEPGEAPWRVNVRYPNQWTPAVRMAAAAPIPRVFLGFSRFPAARWLRDPRTGETTVRWTDMRFATGLTIDQRARAGLFGATVRLDRDGALLEQRLGP